MPSRELRVLVVDDRAELGEQVATGLAALGGFDVLGVACDVQRAGELAAEQPDVALVDAAIGDAATREILAVSPSTRILGHSAATDLAAVVEMLRAGASGYLSRGAAPVDVGAALEATARGETTLGGNIAGGLMADLMQHVDRATRLQQQRSRITDVLDGGAVQIAFQPIVDLESGRVVGHEALSRFTAEPRQGPERWFAEAREVGLGTELELAAMELACECAGILPGGNFLSVNVSPAVVESPRLLALLDSAPVDEIVLEVTEHAPVEDYGRFRRAIAEVRSLGARLAVDDAGAGFSSLRHILEVSADLIKLDASLIQDVEHDRARRSLAAALIAFGSEMGVSILAEGIETSAQLEVLRRLGVRYGQGYHLGRPRPAGAGLAG